MRWDTLEDCRECMPQIRNALQEFNNGRGGSVWGMDSDLIWHMLRRARLDAQGNPAGTVDDEAWFILRAAEVRPQ
jgi:hypothetical protein